MGNTGSTDSNKNNTTAGTGTGGTTTAGTGTGGTSTGGTGTGGTGDTNEENSILPKWSELPLWVRISIIILIIILIFAFILLLIRIAISSSTLDFLLFVIYCVIAIFLEIIFIEILFTVLKKVIFIDPNMELYDYIWYTLLIIIILILLAALIKSFASLSIRYHLVFIAISLSIILLLFTILYYIIKYKDSEPGKVLFIFTIWMIIMTIILIIIQYFVPVFLNVLIVPYSFIALIYILCIVIYSIDFLVKVIQNPSKIIDAFNAINIFEKKNLINNMYIETLDIFTI